MIRPSRRGPLCVRALVAGAILLAMLLHGAAPRPAAAAVSVPLDDAGYLAFADEIALRLDDTWSERRGFYQMTPSMETVYNASQLLVHAVAAERGHIGPARNDERARALVAALLGEPPLIPPHHAPFASKMFHAPGWLKNLRPGNTGMDKSVDPKAAEALVAAWRAREVLRLDADTVARIRDAVVSVARGQFFRYPNVRLNQVNWPAELYAAAAEVGDAELLRTDYPAQVRSFVDGMRRRPTDRTSPNVSPSYRFQYQINDPPQVRHNLDSAEYANMTLQFLLFHDQAVAAGMAPLPAADVRLLRAWVERALLGYWTHAGFLNWDTGLGFDRWMGAKTWAYAQQGLLTIARSPRFNRDPRYARWAKWLFDRGLALHERFDRNGPWVEGVVHPKLFGVAPQTQGVSSGRMYMSRMAANAARAVTLGLGDLPAARPPAFYAFDADIGRLAVSTPRYSGALLAVNQKAVPYGGNELARLFDADGEPVTGIGGIGPAALGIVVRDRRGGRLLASQNRRRYATGRPPLVLERSPRGRVDRLRHLPSDPDAGAFSALRVAGRTESGSAAITSRHTFRAAAIDSQWRIVRRGRDRRYSVSAQFPTWGETAEIDAVLRDGRVVQIAAQGRPAGEVSLRRVAEFRLRSARSAYRLVLRAPVGGRAKAVPVRRQRANPHPGPTLELRLVHRARYRARTLRTRMVPSSRGVRDSLAE